MRPEEVLLILALMGAITTLGLAVIRTVRHYFDRKYPAGAGDIVALRAEVERLRAQVGAAEDVSDRLAELEERLDFTERVLAQQNDRDRLAPGR